MPVFSFDHDKFYTTIPQILKNTFCFYREWQSNESNPVLVSNIEISVISTTTLAKVNPR